MDFPLALFPQESATSRKRMWLHFALFPLLRRENYWLVGIANGNKGSDKDTYHVALALSAVAHQQIQENFIRKCNPMFW